MKNFIPLFILLISPLLLQAQSPSLDPSFNDDGLLQLNLEPVSPTENLIQIAVQEDKKILALGAGKVIRLNADQGIDSEFGNNGEVEIPFGSKIHIHPNGKILIGGNTKDHDLEDVEQALGVIMLNTDGSLDLDFGTQGMAYLSNTIQDGANYLTDLAIQSDGKIIVVGSAIADPQTFDPPAWAIINYSRISAFRLNPDGSLDETYGENGTSEVPVKLHTGAETAGYANSIALQDDDKVIIAGTGIWDLEERGIMAIARLNTDGSMDTDFNNGQTTLGTADYSVRINDILLKEDGQIFLSGYVRDLDDIRSYFIQLSPGGNLDTDFGENGYLYNDFDPFTSLHLLLLPQGEIIFSNFLGRVQKVTQEGNITEVNIAGVPEGSGISGPFALQQEGKLIAIGFQRQEFPIIDHWFIARIENITGEDMLRTTRFTLINAETNEELFDLEDGQTINLQEIGTNEINIRAYTDPEPTGSVRFILSGAETRNHIETNAYYALFANLGEDFFSWKPALGAYQLTATPYTESGARGEAGTALSISFSITDEAVSDLPAVERFTLINAQTNEELFVLQEGHVIDLAEIGTNEINIRAYTNPEPTGSVRFNLTGAQVYNHIENNAYYALYANLGEDFFSWEPALGNYELTATAYTESRAAGEAGSPLTLSFTVIDSRENENARRADAFPNPGNSTLFISNPNNEALNVMMFDLTGKQVLHRSSSSNQGNNRMEIDVSNLENNSYIIQIITDNEVQNIRWMKE